MTAWIYCSINWFCQTLELQLSWQEKNHPILSRVVRCWWSTPFCFFRCTEPEAPQRHWPHFWTNAINTSVNSPLGFHSFFCCCCFSFHRKQQHEVLPFQSKIISCSCTWLTHWAIKHHASLSSLSDCLSWSWLLFTSIHSWSITRWEAAEPKWSDTAWDTLLQGSFPLCGVSLGEKEKNNAEK